MVVNCKGKHMRRKHVWFENISDAEQLFVYKRDCDEVIIHGNETSLHGKNIGCEMQESLITDLTLDSADIMQQFSKTVRNEISRAEREQVQCVYCDSASILQNDFVLEKMAEMYHMMYESKGIQDVYLSLSELKGYAKNNRLLISYTMINQEICVFHSYVFDNHCCRLLHSCSEFRVEDNQKRNAIGRSNKFLHWQDILTFQNMGLQKYDWGGVSSISSPNGIDKFKLSFGGIPILYYNISRAVSFKMKLYRLLKNR